MAVSKTGLLWLIIYIGGLGTTFIKGPIIGLLTYMFTFYTQFSWARGVKVGLYRWSFYAAIVLLASYLLKRGSYAKEAFSRIPQLKWLILIIINMLFVSLFAADPKENQEAVVDFIKLVVLYYLIVNIVKTRMHYRMFIWVQIWGNFLLGWLAYTKGDMVGGRLENIGAPGIRGSNHLANHLIMSLPFIGNLTLFGNKWEKLGAIAAAPFILNALVLCNSRGAFLGIALMLVTILVLSKSQNRSRIIIGLVLAGVLFTFLADERILNRLQTIQSYEEDGSAMGRIDSWVGALKMVSDYPFGKGGGGFQAYSHVYIPEIVEKHGGEPRSVHNTFLLMATDWGIQGFFLFFIFYFSTFLELHKIRRRSGTDHDNFYYVESVAIEVALVGFLVSATFGSRIYGEGVYWYCALATALSNIQQNEILKQSIEKASEEEDEEVELEYDIPSSDSNRAVNKV